MRVPVEEHTSRPWRIHEVAAGFEVEDVWALPVTGKADEWRQAAEMMAGDPGSSPSAISRFLFAVRWELGRVFGWDDTDGRPVPTLLDRLPDDLRAAPPPPKGERSPFTPLFLTDDEYAAEIVNKTVHGVLHLGRIPTGDDGEFTAHMAVLVRPNGRWGRVYLAAIKPFRYLFVYPALMKQIEADWRQRAAPSTR
jgi:hypothetical protein